MTEDRSRQLLQLSSLKRWVAAASVATFAALFGLAAHHASGPTTSTPATSIQSTSTEDDFFGDSDDFELGGDQSFGAGSGTTVAPQAQTRVS